MTLVRDPAVYTGKADVRAGILVTGTEVLTGIISDRNGPWLSERLMDLGVDVARIDVVGDRPEDLRTALRHMADDGLRLIVTSGGLGPTADDLTAEIVGRFCGREMVLDEELEQQIFDIIKPLLSRWPDTDPEVLRAANRKQAVVPSGAIVLAPQGTAPGLVVPPTDGRGPTVVVLPGPPGELMPMWADAVRTEAFRQAISGATVYRHETIRLTGVPEAAIAQTLRDADAHGLNLEPLEITTCLRRGEIEVSTRFEPDAQGAYTALVDFIAQQHGRHLFSRNGETIDDQVAALLLERAETIATAESCTGGLLAARLTERAGSSAYVIGGAVVYSNEAKTAVIEVPSELIMRHGAVSEQVAGAMAQGALARFETNIGVGITGIAGPGGGTPEKPVGTVCFGVAHAPGSAGGKVHTLTRRVQLPGDRAAVRERSTTIAMHLIARALRGEAD